MGPLAARALPVLPGSDELLARLVASGSERAFRALYDRYHLPLFRYCDSIVRNEADAQDALQSSFTRALVALRQGKRNAPLRPWLYRIAHNESVSLLRTRRRALSEAGTSIVPAAAPSAQERADERARFHRLLADLGQLTERARAALVMRELGGLSHEEIASALAISLGAAKQAIFEARSALLELEQGRAMACDEVMRKLSDGDRRILRRRQLRAHLRDCASCSAFAAAIPSRQAKLRALAPALPPAAAAAVLARSLQGSSCAGGGAATAGSSTVASTVKVLAAAATPKALLATAVVAGVAAGASGLVGGSSARHASAAPAVESIHTLGRIGAGRAASQRRSDSAQRSSSTRAAAPGTHRNSSSTGRNPGPGATLHKHSSGPPPWSQSPNAQGPSNSPGNSGNSASRTGEPPGLVRHDHTPPGLTKHDHTPPGLAKKTG